MSWNPLYLFGLPGGAIAASQAGANPWEGALDGELTALTAGIYHPQAKGRPQGLAGMTQPKDPTQQWDPSWGPNPYQHAPAQMAQTMPPPGGQMPFTLPQQPKQGPF